MPTVVAMSVTRTELSLADLNIDDLTNYAVTTFSPGSPGNTLKKVSADWVDEDVVTGKRRGNATANLTVDVVGSSHASCATKLTALVNAFNQLNFNWSIVYDTTTTYTWACHAASVIDADMEARQFEYGYVLTVRFTFERKPIPVAGPL